MCKIFPGIVDDTGGAITMMNMVAQTGTSKAYDCVWLVKNTAREAPESQISIRVAQFEEMGEGVFPNFHSSAFIAREIYRIE